MSQRLEPLLHIYIYSNLSSLVSVSVSARARLPLVRMCVRRVLAGFNKIISNTYAHCANGDFSHQALRFGCVRLHGMLCVRWLLTPLRVSR